MIAMKSATFSTTENGEVICYDNESSFFRDANSLQYASVDDVPSPQAVDRLVTDINKQLGFIR
jgi:pre-mRNA-splicing factor SYF2